MRNNYQTAAEVATRHEWEQPQDSSVLTRPLFLTNDEVGDRHPFKQVLVDELENCDSFAISVAFITQGVITGLFETLRSLTFNGCVKGRILTTDYLYFTHPKALRMLISFPNIEVRMFRCAGDRGFHTKGYIFRHKEIAHIIIGSSNLTDNAVERNHEWNAIFLARNSDSFARRISEEYETLWNSDQTVPVTEALLTVYEAVWRDMRSNHERLRRGPVQSGRALVPNAMQLEFIRNLSELCERQATRAMLISATGTGKTYAAAFAMRDAKGLNPRRILFLVHRAQIALQAQRSFERVLGARYSYGQLSGTQKETDKSCLFATIQTMSKADVLKQFHPDCFDVIIIDESHRSGAGTYQKVMEYFKPRLWLGMTATPERSDGFNVFELFHHNIAHEIRLEQALKADMLCPFHYFGIADVTVNGQVIKDKSPISALTDSSRVDHILREAELRGYSGSRPRGLIFCSSTEECRRLSEALNGRKLQTVALSGKSSRAEREEAVRRLAQIDDEGRLDYILTVDIFNEGIDIPEINQIIMLRPTQSAIIFVQQLGRGLRKCEGKDFVVVLDFIGNYKNSFLIPIALSGDNSFDKDSLRRFMMLERKRIPGASTVQFDQVAKERIFDAIDHANTESMALLRESYKLLREKLGRIPTLVEFDSNNAVDPVKIFKASGSYHAFKKKVDPEYTVSFDDRAERLLSVVSRKLGRGTRLSEAIVLEDLLNGRSSLREHLKAALTGKNAGLIPSERHLDNVMDVLSNRYFKIGRPTKESSSDRSADYALIEEDDGDWRASRQFEKTLAANPGLLDQIRELTDFIRHRYEKAYSNRYKDTDLVLYEKYSYEEVGRLLNWNQNITPQSIGGYFYDKESGTLPVFINYEKTGNAILYEDRFVSEKELIAVSKTNVTPKSKDADHIYKRRPEDRANRLFLFVRRNKNDQEAKAFYFLGEIRAVGEPKAVTLKDKRAFEIEYRLDTPVKQDLYRYLTAKER